MAIRVSMEQKSSAKTQRSNWQEEDLRDGGDGRRTDVAAPKHLRATMVERERDEGGRVLSRRSNGDTPTGKKQVWLES
jgi:hypothetical protein